MQTPLVKYLRPIGDFYVALLQMCVLPFLLATIPLAVRSAMTSGTASHVVRLLAIWVVVAVVAVATATIVVSTLVFNFFVIDEALLARIGGFVGASADRIDVEFALDPARAGPGAVSIDSGLLAVIPTNIFASLANNDSTRVLVFAAIFGIAMVMTERQSGRSVFGALRLYPGSLRNDLRLVWRIGANRHRCSHRATNSFARFGSLRRIGYIRVRVFPGERAGSDWRNRRCGGLAEALAARRAQEHAQAHNVGRRYSQHTGLHPDRS